MKSPFQINESRRGAVLLIAILTRDAGPKQHKESHGVFSASPRKAHVGITLHRRANCYRVILIASRTCRWIRRASRALDLLPREAPFGASRPGGADLARATRV